MNNKSGGAGGKKPPPPSAICKPLSHGCVFKKGREGGAAPTLRKVAVVEGIHD